MSTQKHEPAETRKPPIGRTAAEPGDGRNERQRARHEEEIARERDDRPLIEREEDPKARSRLLEDKPFDFIERTRPEDPLADTSHHGQQTRDNVNPAIPSVSPEETGPPNARVKDPGGIVDPKRLGMEGTAGVAPPAPENQPEQWPSLGLDHTKDATDQVQEAENRQRQAKEGGGGLGEADRLTSINEPPGSRIYTGEDGPNQAPTDPQNLPELTLTAIDPDTIPVQPENITETTLTVTGTGFGPNCVVLFDDEEVPTTLVNSTTLRASVPIAPAVGTYDVEVQRGEDLSDVLTFEIAAAESGGARTRKEQQRKPKKAEPASKRTKKSKK
jgi:hypothetical protein